MRIEVDPDDQSYDDLDDEQQAEVSRLVTRYADHGVGGTVLYPARGAAEYDVLRGDGVEVEVRINREHPRGPTLVVVGCYVAEDDPMEDD